MEQVAGDRRYERGPMLAALAVVAAFTLVGFVDYLVTADDLPDRREFELAYALEREVEERTWWYAAAALIAIVVALAVSWRRTPPSERRESFTDLGVAAVVWLLATLVLALVTDSADVQIPMDPMFALGGGAAAIAAIGTLATTGRSAGEPSWRAGWMKRLRETSRGSMRVGLILTLVVVAAAVVLVLEYGNGCERDPEWHDTAIFVLGGVVIAEVVCGLLTLAARRWFAALVMLGVGPFAWVIAALAGACLS